MREIPYLKNDNGRVNLIVDGKPYLILGGEFHNSDGSDPSFMDEKVWPAVRESGCNCFLTPVYWEALEKEKGKYDFNLVDSVLSQARRENVHLCLLWFGLWKNGKSSYVPGWMKKNSQYTYITDVHGVMQESVSPFCEGAVECDRKAFTALMEHLREVDEERTVLMIQVENECGIWGGSQRDYSKEAEQIYRNEVPESIAALYDVSGIWEEAFGARAGEMMMAWGYASAVEKIASSGSRAYPLPMFVNSVPGESGLSRQAGDYPSGGPVIQALKLWKKVAPTIALYGPDIYSPNFREIVDDYGRSGPVIVPEAGSGKDCVSEALYTVAAHNTLMFSPFGIEEMMRPVSENDSLAATNLDHGFPMYRAPETLREGYRLLHILWAQIEDAQKKGTIRAFLFAGIPGEEFSIGNLTFTVTYNNATFEPGKPPVFGEPRHKDAPIGGGFVIREDDRLLICAVSCNIRIRTVREDSPQIFILDKAEYRVQDGTLVRGRTLNGDQRNYLAFGAEPQVQTISFYTR